MLDEAKSLLDFYKSCGVYFLCDNKPISKFVAPQQKLDSVVTSNTFTKTLGTNKPISSARIINSQEAEIVNQAKQLTKDCKTLEDLDSSLIKFTGCGFKSSAKHTLFYNGSLTSDQILVIKDFPYSAEERSGRFLEGTEGEMINKMFKAIGIAEDQFTILNTVFWRPPGERTLKTYEIEQCDPFIKKFIELLSPKAIFILGGTGAYSLFRSKEPITKVRGQAFDYNGIKTMISYSPKTLEKTPVLKKYAFDDLLAFKKFL